jgi:DNA-binding MarR family transcriptional regulator
MPIDPQSLESLAGFRFALRRFLAASEAISKAGGVTPQQYQAMLAIRAWPDGRMSIKDLAEQLLLTHHAAVQLVDRLAKAGLAQRAPSPTDRRSVSLSLTEAGVDQVEALAAQHLDAMLGQEPLLSRSLQTLRSISARA